MTAFTAIRRRPPHRLQFNVSLLLLLFSITAITISSQDVPKLPAFTKPKAGLIRPSSQIFFGSGSSFASVALAFDSQLAYVGTPSGLYRASLPLGPQSSFTKMAFVDKAIYNVYVDNGSLYVLKESMATQGPAADHAFLRSDDHGVTFVPLDDALQECIGGLCEFLAPTQAIFKNGVVLTNAGGTNLFVTANNGASWTPLMGGFHRSLCSPQAFEIVNDRILVGGDCPLDFTYLKSGTLRPNLLAWEQFPSDATTPDLQNRNVQFIKNKPNTADIFAGVAGGLLKSTDGGQSFKYVLYYPFGPGGGGRFPIMRSILMPTSAAGVIVVGGGDGRPFLAYSKDNGETWLDISTKTMSMVADAGPAGSDYSVDFIVEDATGNIFAGLVNRQTCTIKIIRLNVNYAMFR
jgi:hypothetical protein